MRVARLHGAGDLRVGRRAEARARARASSLVRVEAVGVCGSDLHWFEEGAIGDARLDAPLVIGHEFAGVVEAGPLAGRRVAVDPAIPCERCDLCREGPSEPLPRGEVRRPRELGRRRCRQYLSWPTRRLHPLPESLDGVAGALLEPLGVAIHAVDLGHVGVGARVAIVGCGPIGLLLAQVCVAAGASVALAVDPLEHRRAAAERAGAEVAIAPGDPWDGEQVDVAFEAAGTDEAVDVAAARRAAGSARGAGRHPGRRSHDLLGLDRAPQGRTRSCSSAAWGRSIRGRSGSSRPARSTRSRSSPHRFPLDRVSDAFALAAAREGLKVVVEP